MNNGPISRGTYYIVDRKSGGRLGFLGDAVKDVMAGTTRRDWFALYRDDGIIDDKTSINGVVRGAFRLNPVGYWGISEGCAMLLSVATFHCLREFFRDQQPVRVDGISYYGVLVVR